MAMAVTQSESIMFQAERQSQDSFKILEQMQKERILCDVTLVAKNIEIPAHKNVLASCSKYFYSMFTNFQTAKLERIEMDVNPQILLSLVNYMYTSKLTVQKRNIENVLLVAKMLLLNRVQDGCKNVLELTMGPNNCFQIKRIAANCGDPKLLNRASSYIDDNFVHAVASDEFLNLTSDEITELISKDTLKIPSEETVYECIVRWVSYNQKERRKYLRLLMGYVRMRFISKDYIKQHIVNGSFLKGDYYCKDLIINALLENNSTPDTKTKPRLYKKGVKVLLVVGGDEEESSNNFEYYDFGKKHWSTPLEMPFNVTDAGLVAVNQKVYIIGGLRDGNHVQTVNYFDIDTNNWDSIDDMIMTRSLHGVGILNNCIYAVGGCDGFYCHNSAEKYDFQTLKWTAIAPMLKKRYCLGVGFLNGILYAVGGFNKINNNTLKSVECYDERTNTWNELSSMNDCRAGLGVCALDGKLYAIGGRNEEQRLSTVEEYNPVTDTWTLITPMKVARNFPAVAVVDNKIYVTGGYDGNKTLDSTEVYNRATNLWTILYEEMNTARRRHAAVIVDKYS